MLKDTKNLLKGSLPFLAIAVTLVIAILSLIKLGEPPIKINNLDKIQHAIAYFVLTLVWLLAFGKTKKMILLIAFCCLFYGIVIEVLQVTLTSYRAAEFLDAVANSIGVFIALLIFKYFFRKKQSI